MNDGSSKAADLKVLKKQRVADIKEQVKRNRSGDRFIYLLLEPTEDVVRYVGCCGDPVARYGAHIYGGSGKVRQWIALLESQGQLPRMEVVGVVSCFGFWCNRAVSVSTHAEAIEKSVIDDFLQRRSTGGLSLPSDLLNIQ